MKLVQMEHTNLIKELEEWLEEFKQVPANERAQYVSMVIGRTVRVFGIKDEHAAAKEGMIDFQFGASVCQEFLFRPYIDEHIDRGE